MATVNNQLTRIHDAEGTLTTANVPSGGGGATANTDIFIQASQSLGKRLTETAGPAGYVLIDAADNDCSAADVHVGMWLWVTHYALLDDYRIILATGTGTPTTYDLHTYPYSSEWPKLGGWNRVWVDVSRTPENTGSGGGLTESQLRSYGFQLSFSSAPGGSAANTMIDAADFTDGTAALDLTGTSGVWTDFTTADENTTNQYGVFRNVGGVFNCFARVQLGQSGASLVFNDSNFVIVFPQQSLVADTFMGITVDLQNASTNVDWANGVLRSAGAKKGDLVCVGTSGDFDAVGMSLISLRVITLTSVCSLTNSKIIGCGQITAAGATMTDTQVSGYEGAVDSSALVWDVATDPNTYLANMTFTKGTAATHAIEFGTSSPTTMTLDGVVFSGYNAADSQNDSAVYFARTTGDVYVSISNGSVPTYKSAGATIHFSSSVNVTLDGLAVGTEVRVYDTSSGAYIDGVESTAGDEFTFSYTAGETVYIRIFHLEYLPADIIDYVIPGSATVVPVSQVVDRNYVNP